MTREKCVDKPEKILFLGAIITLHTSSRGRRSRALKNKKQNTMAPVKRKFNGNGSSIKKVRTTAVPKTVPAFARSTIAPELKFFDTVVAGTALATTGVITSASLNIVPQGTTESERVGRKMIIKKLGIRFLLQFNNGTAETADVVRIIVVLDKQTNKTAFAITDVLETASEGSFNNMANKGRFLILMDRYESINKTTDIGTNVNEFTQAWSWFSKELNIPIEFDNTATTGAMRATGDRDSRCVEE